MTNSMKDLLLGLGFKPPPLPHKDVPMSWAQGAQKRPPESKSERSDASRHPNQRNTAQCQPSQQRNPAQRPDGTARDAHPRRAEHGPQKPRAEQGARPEHGAHRPRHAPQQRTREEIDLAKAYAIRAQKEKDERIEAERVKQEAARIKREAKAKIAELLKDKSLNAADAEITRHFEYNGKIRRVHVTEAQLKSLNAGELGVVQLDGRYLLVESTLTREVESLLPSLVALLVDPHAPAVDDPYADPQYVVPDDLVW